MIDTLRHRMSTMKLWHGVVAAVAIIAIAGLLSLTIGVNVFFPHGTHR
jgi:hypothetical protein